MSRSLDRLRRALAIPLSLLVAFGPLLQAPIAGAQTPTAEQLKAFQSLPKEQRDAILQQMGGGAGRAAPADAINNQITVQQPGAAIGHNLVLPPQEPRITGGELLLVRLPRIVPAAGVTPVAADDALRRRILERNPYELSAEGTLQLPGLEPIALAGLTAREVQERLELEPTLRDLSVSVTLLRVEPQGVKALKPFGYDIFRGAANAFVPGTDIPVPDDYKLGTGDTMTVQLYGQTTQVYTLPVTRDGDVSLPEFGPVHVAGLSFSAARSLIEQRVRKQMMGTQARVALRDLRSARVLVLGDAEQPGSYVVSGLATVTQALFASGGVKPIGSLRRIEVKRGGTLIRQLDLYDELLKGDTANDVRLMTGDAVFIPPVGATVGVDGAVRRPAIYELRHEKTVGELLVMAGGLTPQADERSVTLERIEAGRDRTIRSLDLTTSAGRAYLLRAGDLVRIGSTLAVVENGIAIEGHVFRPGTFAYREGLRISDLIRSADDLKPSADLHYLLVRREDAATRRVEVFSADLEAALSQRGSAADLLLRPRDRISVFDLVSPRSRIIEPLVEELRRQARPDAPAETASVAGRVNAPGRYPLEPGMRISDLLRAGGGLEDAAYAITAELTRYDAAQGEQRRTELRDIDIAAVLKGDAAANVALQPYDLLTIKQMPDWGSTEEVTVLGEVRFPGAYRIRRGESLSSVVARAGGLTPLAFPRGAAFTREELREREREQLDQLATRLQSELASLALQSAQAANVIGGASAAEAQAAGQALLQQLRATQPIGRLVIDLRGVSAGTRTGDVTLRDGDRLYVPRQTEEITVLGEVQNPTSHLYRPGLTRDEAIALSGGFTSRADQKRAYVVRADGSVLVPKSGWTRSGNVDLGPGDNVIVPVDAEKMRPLPMWTAITTIIYNLAIAATAIARL